MARIKHDRALRMTAHEASEYARLESMIEDYAVLAICHPGEAKAARRAINVATRELQSFRRA